MNQASSVHFHAVPKMYLHISSPNLKSMFKSKGALRHTYFRLRECGGKAYLKCTWPLDTSPN